MASSCNLLCPFHSQIRGLHACENDQDFGTGRGLPRAGVRCMRFNHQSTAVSTYRYSFAAAHAVSEAKPEIHPDTRAQAEPHLEVR